MRHYYHGWVTANFSLSVGLCSEFSVKRRSLIHSRRKCIRRSGRHSTHTKIRITGKIQQQQQQNVGNISLLLAARDTDTGGNNEHYTCIIFWLIAMEPIDYRSLGYSIHRGLLHCWRLEQRSPCAHTRKLYLIESHNCDFRLISFSFELIESLRLVAVRCDGEYAIHATRSPICDPECK